MLKPMCIFYSSHKLADYDDEAVRHCYKVFSPKELFDFLNMIERDEDPMREFRQQKAKEYVKHFDGKNGWRIKEFIKQAFKDKFN